MQEQIFKHRETQLLTVKEMKQDREAIIRAGQIIRQGGLVALPTETVYGLGANALNPDAVKNIFLAKGRPQDNPLIIHIEDASQAERMPKTSRRFIMSCAGVFVRDR